MGFFSRLIGFFTQKQPQGTVPPAKPTAAAPQSAPVAPAVSSPPATLTPVSPHPDSEAPPLEAFMQQVAEVRSSFAQAAQAAISTVENLGEKASLSKPSSKSSGLVTGKLEEKIAHWGDSKQVQYVPPLLRYINASDHTIQTIAATALGKIAKANPARSETQQMIPAMARLLRSPHTGVCQAAIVALGEIQSAQVLPLLQSALRNSSGDVAKAASVAIKRLKLKPEKPQPVLARPIPQRLSRF